MKKKQNNIICMADWKKRMEMLAAQEETEPHISEKPLNHVEIFLMEFTAENNSLDDDEYPSGMLIW